MGKKKLHVKNLFSMHFGTPFHRKKNPFTKNIVMCLSFTSQTRRKAVFIEFNDDAPEHALCLFRSFVSHPAITSLAVQLTGEQTRLRPT
jgi:hypothetical protein